MAESIEVAEVCAFCGHPYEEHDWGGDQKCWRCDCQCFVREEDLQE